MESRPIVHIKRIQVTISGELVTVHVTIRGDFQGKIAADIMDPGSKVRARTESGSPRFALGVIAPLKWSPDEPDLYTLKISTSVDEVSETFGFRTIETKNGQILLNG